MDDEDPETTPTIAATNGGCPGQWFSPIHNHRSRTAKEAIKAWVAEES